MRDCRDLVYILESPALVQQYAHLKSNRICIFNLITTHFVFGSDILKILVMALGAGLAVWGVINLLEGYGSDNPAANAHVR